MVGKLQYSETDGLGWGSSEVLPNAYEWPGIPGRETYKWPGISGGIEKTERPLMAYLRTLHADSTYRQAAAEFLERQRLEPQAVWQLGKYLTQCWAYKDTIFKVESDEPDIDVHTVLLLLKHFMLKRSRYYEKIRREVEALENLEKLQRVERELIPEAVRLFVWQRDKGQCVKCGARQRLEFDHIIPVAAGGSNTERNIQLLCESCNRSKGSTI